MKFSKELIEERVKNIDRMIKTIEKEVDLEPEEGEFHAEETACNKRYRENRKTVIAVLTAERAHLLAPVPAESTP